MNTVRKRLDEGGTRRYPVAVGVTAAAVLLRWLMDPWLGDNLPFVTLFAAVAAAVYDGGYRPALVATMLGFLACDYLFIEPRGSFAILQAGAYIGLVLYLFTCCVIIGLGEAMRSAQRRTQSAQELLRVTLASIGDAVITTDTDSRTAYLNAIAESVTGWTQQDAVGQRLDTVFRIVNEQTHLPVENPATRALREGVIVGLANHTVLIAKDGTERPIDDSAAPIRDARGRVLGCVLVFRDITERRRIEQHRADNEARIRSVVNHVVDGIITIDETAAIESFNPAAERLFGYTAEEVSGQNVRVLMPEPFHSEHNGYIAAYLDTGQAKIIGIGREVEGRRKDGSTFPMELAVSEFALGGRRYFTGIVRDITERKRAEKQTYELLIELKEADRRKDEFLATLAHELRGPLAPLCNALEIIKRADGHDAWLQQARSAMERQLPQMVRLVDDLLDVSRITRNKLELRRHRIELAAVVDQAVETCRPLFEALHHHVTVALPPEPIYLDGDAARLSQVFGNLLNNACKYTEPGGRIQLTAERRDGEVRVAVQDNGIGIPPDMLPRIFERFTQADRTLERSQGGIGVGLALAKQLVEMHEGTVEAFSEGPGCGCEFVVQLPILVGKPTVLPPSEPTTSTPATTACRILIVDDNRDSAESLVTLLQITGHETHAAYDGLEAVAAAQQFRPDLMLLDIGLPKLNGLDACRRIREQPWGQKMVIVAISGWGQDEDRRKAKDAGFDHHMVKPVEYAVLLNLLTTLSSQRAIQG